MTFAACLSKTWPLSRFAVERPALDDWQAREIGLIAFEHDFLADAGSHRFGGKLPILIRSGSFFIFSMQRGGNFRFNQLIDAGGECFEVICPEGPIDAPVAAEGVDGDGDVGPFDVFEEEGFAAEFSAGVTIEFVMAVRGGGFADAIGDLGDFQDRRTCVFTRDSSPAWSISLMNSEKVSVAIAADRRRSSCWLPVASCWSVQSCQCLAFTSN